MALSLWPRSMEGESISYPDSSAVAERMLATSDCSAPVCPAIVTTVTLGFFFLYTFSNYHLNKTTQSFCFSKKKKVSILLKVVSWANTTKASSLQFPPGAWTVVYLFSEFRVAVNRSLRRAPENWTTLQQCPLCSSPGCWSAGWSTSSHGDPGFFRSFHVLRINYLIQLTFRLWSASPCGTQSLKGPGAN